MTIDMATLGARLRAVREGCGFTQEDVARHLGIHRPSYVQVENGKRGLSTLEFSRLSGLFNRQVEHFFREDFDSTDRPYSLADAPGKTITSAAFAAKVVGLAMESYRREEASASWLEEFAAELGLTIDQMVKIDGVTSSA